MERVNRLAGASRDWSSVVERSSPHLSPSLFLVFALGGTALLFWSAFQGHVLIVLALLIAGGGFFLVIPRPEFGILIVISTMLLTYPDILKGSGLLTINNLLGALFFLLLLVKTFINRDLWFLREKEVKILIFLGLLFLLSTAAAEYTVPKLRYPLVQEGRLIRDFTRPWLQDFFTRGIAFLIFFVNFISSRHHVKYVLLVLLACILVAVPPSLQAYATGVGEDFRVTASKSAFFSAGVGWISNPNRFAFMCLVGISLLFYFAMITRRQGVKLLVVPGIMSLTALIFLAGSRSGFLG
ncbi:MAG: hypothetical protein ACE5JO_07850, partial [Candidatus Binatia bacterium]